MREMVSLITVGSPKSIFLRRGRGREFSRLAVMACDVNEVGSPPISKIRRTELPVWRSRLIAADDAASRGVSASHDALPVDRLRTRSLSC